MRRLFWMGVGAAAAVVAAQRLRAAWRRYTPEARRRAGRAGRPRRGRGRAQRGRTTFTDSFAAREHELTHALLVGPEGGDPLAVFRRRTAPGAGGHRHRRVRARPPAGSTTTSRCTTSDPPAARPAARGQGRPHARDRGHHAHRRDPASLARVLRAARPHRRAVAPRSSRPTRRRCSRSPAWCRSSRTCSAARPRRGRAPRPCRSASGRSDIDEVGKTTRHGTFFQMNGNFSFGDYFKEGAIEYAWELVTGSQADGCYGFDPDKVWVTVYEEDDEAAALWRKVAGLPERADPAPRQEGQLLAHRPARARRAVLGDLHRPRPAVRSRGRPGGGRGPVPGDLEPGLHAVRDRGRPAKDDFRIVGRPEAEEHRHRHGSGARRVPAAGRGQHVRDRRGLPGHRRRPGDVGPSVRRRPRRRRADARGRRPRALRASC